MGGKSLNAGVYKAPSRVHRARTSESAARVAALKSVCSGPAFQSGVPGDFPPQFRRKGVGMRLAASLAT